jgi:hypothetical protein
VGLRHGRVGHIPLKALTLREVKTGGRIGSLAPPPVLACCLSAVTFTQVERDRKRVEHAGRGPLCDIGTPGHYIEVYDFCGVFVVRFASPG